MGVTRFVFFLFPLLRKPRGIQRVLETKATESLPGFILDVLKMGWG
jgi:hypothetical protein